MKTGVELIAIERDEQIHKHGRDVQSDVECNQSGQLAIAAAILLGDFVGTYLPTETTPDGWNQDVWDKMTNKSYEERIIIAGALCAAEYDRLQAEKAPSNEEPDALPY